MMKLRNLPGLILLAAVLAACAPAASTVPTVEPLTVEASATFVPAASTMATSAQVTEGPTVTLAPTSFPVATSRGPNLEATDPTTVSMASGGLQLVEFFEFW